MEFSNLGKHYLIKFKKISNNLENNYTSKIIINNFFSINEIKIGNKIKKNIINFYNYFYLIDNYDFLTIENIGEDYIENLSLSNVELNRKYFIFKYKKISYESFNNFFYKINNPKAFLLYSIDSFSSLLKSLLLLENNNICFLNLSTNNIIFHYEKPILYHFENSISLSKLKEENICNFIIRMKDFIFLPLDIHVLFYLFKNNLNTLTVSLIKEICSNYIKNIKDLLNLNNINKEEFNNLCIQSLQKYINSDKIIIINSILLNSNKWNIYSLSIIYLHLFSNFNKIYSNSSIYLTYLINDLILNIHPDSNKRDTLNNLLEKFNNKFPFSWNFVLQFPQNKMKELHENLDL